MLSVGYNAEQKQLQDAFQKAEGLGDRRKGIHWESKAVLRIDELAPKILRPFLYHLEVGDRS